MRYVMKQSSLLGDDFTIKDEHSETCSLLMEKPSALERSSRFKICRERTGLHPPKLLAWGPTYEIYRGSELAAIVKKALFTFLYCKFTVDVPGPDDLEARGDFSTTSTIHVGEESWPPSPSSGSLWTDTYGVEIADGGRRSDPGQHSGDRHGFATEINRQRR